MILKNNSMPRIQFLNSPQTMKTPLLALALFVSMLPALATDGTPGFVSAMTTALDKLRKARNAADLEAAARQFDSLAAARPTEWLAPYWSGYTYTQLAWLHADKGQSVMDGYLEKAEARHTAAERLAVNDETVVLGAYIASARLAAAPWIRWVSYGPKVDAGIAKAKRLNPANPRPYLLEGESLYHKPAMFGGGKKRALPVLKVAEQKFAVFTPASPLHPTWDPRRLRALLARCAE